MVFALVDALELDTDLPVCSMTDKDVEEQIFLLSLMRDPYLPPGVIWDIEVD
jgi:hypothetical protein